MAAAVQEVKRSVSAVVLVDFGFGDAGKGLVTDYLVRELGARTVVRFNGGAQAGHNVVTSDGRHHTFSQFGAGTFVPGVRTHLSRHVVVHPTALLREAEYLASVGVSDALARLTISADALVVTPYHQASGRLRELARGEQRHGSCGAGVGEAVRDSIFATADVLRVRDLADRTRLRRALARVRERKRAELEAVRAKLTGLRAADAECRVLLEDAIGENWLERVTRVVSQTRLSDDGELRHRLREEGPVVFEGAHGVLLDEWCGFHPYTTWSTCTFDNALAMLRESDHRGEVTRLGVLRAYACRHGVGPLPTEDSELSDRMSEPHNPIGPWQGPFRVGWPDFLLWQYAVQACGGVDGLAITHLDEVARMTKWKWCRGYRVADQNCDSDLFDREMDTVTRIRAPLGRDLNRQARLTLSIGKAQALYDEVLVGASVGHVVERFEAMLGVRVRLTSFGPTAQDVRVRGL